MNKPESNQKRIYQSLLDNIRKNVYPQGNALPSLRDLAKQYFSTPGTVRQALLKLQNAGYVTARRGSGYYVNKEFNGAKNILVLERLSGPVHLFSTFADELHANFRDLPEYSIYFEDALRYCDKPQLLSDRLNVYSGKLDAIFFNGEEMRNFPKEEILKLQKHIKLYYYYRVKQNFAMSGIPGVSSDWDHGHYIAIRHLIDCGCRRILVCLLDLAKYDGAQAAVRDSAQDVELIYAANDSKLFEKLETETYDGIFCYQDFAAVKVIHKLKKLGYRMPGDIAVVGYFNTPWSEHPDCPVTSVNICEKEMIRRVVEMFTGEREEEQIRLLPKLEIRASTSEYKKK